MLTSRGSRTLRQPSIRLAQLARRRGTRRELGSGRNPELPDVIDGDFDRDARRAELTDDGWDPDRSNMVVARLVVPGHAGAGVEPGWIVGGHVDILALPEIVSATGRGIAS